MPARGAAEAADAGGMKANSAATEAGQRADAANSLAQQAQQGRGEAGRFYAKAFQNLDNYKASYHPAGLFRLQQEHND